MISMCVESLLEADENVTENEQSWRRELAIN